jgi:RNA polymerase sigma-70 factor (ECF subfamily)
MPDPTPALHTLSTNWADIAAAHGTGLEVREAQRAVLRRYCRAVYHYLHVALGDPHTAEDLSQDFALRFLRGDFHRLHPARGRFRDFVRTVLNHLIADHYRRRRAAPKALPPDEAAAPAAGPNAGDEEFARRWRDELLGRAWDELGRTDGRGSPLLHAALRWRAEHPDAPTTAGAAALTQSLGRPVTDAAFRQALHRARDKFSDLLRAEVAFSLGTSDPDQIGAELADLGLLAYCRPAAGGRPSEPEA